MEYTIEITVKDEDNEILETATATGFERAEEVLGDMARHYR